MQWSEKNWQDIHVYPLSSYALFQASLVQKSLSSLWSLPIALYAGTLDPKHSDHNEDASFATEQKEWMEERETSG